MMHYEIAGMGRTNNGIDALIKEMRNLPEGVVSVENDWSAGIRTYVYNDGRRVTRSTNDNKATTSASRSSKSAYELKASLKKTMREADQNISDFIRRIAQLDVEISRSTMRGQYTGFMQHQRDDLLQRIKQLEAVKGRCAALLGEA